MSGRPEGLHYITIQFCNALIFPSEAFFAAVGDLFSASGGVAGRITDMRRVGQRWLLELTLLRVGAE